MIVGILVLFLSNLHMKPLGYAVCTAEILLLKLLLNGKKI